MKEHQHINAKTSFVMKHTFGLSIRAVKDFEIKFQGTIEMKFSCRREKIE